jgi:hypothetical protein
MTKYPTGKPNAILHQNKQNSMLWRKLYDSDSSASYTYKTLCVAAIYRLMPPHVSQVEADWSECFSHRGLVRGG